MGGQSDSLSPFTPIASSESSCARHCIHARVLVCACSVARVFSRAHAFPHCPPIIGHVCLAVSTYRRLFLLMFVRDHMPRNFLHLFNNQGMHSIAHAPAVSHRVIYARTCVCILCRLGALLSFALHVAFLFCVRQVRDRVCSCQGCSSYGYPLRGRSSLCRRHATPSLCYSSAAAAQPSSVVLLRLCRGVPRRCRPRARFASAAPRLPRGCPARPFQRRAGSPRRTQAAASSAASDNLIWIESGRNGEMPSPIPPV